MSAPTLPRLRQTLTRSHWEIDGTRLAVTRGSNGWRIGLGVRVSKAEMDWLCDSPLRDASFRTRTEALRSYAAFAAVNPPPVLPVIKLIPVSLGVYRTADRKYVVRRLPSGTWSVGPATEAPDSSHYAVISLYDAGRVIAEGQL